jgi:hypothetical protein
MAFTLPTSNGFHTHNQQWYSHPSPAMVFLLPTSNGFHTHNQQWFHTHNQQ